MDVTQQIIKQLIRDAQQCDQAAALATLPHRRARFTTMAMEARAQAREWLANA